MTFDQEPTGRYIAAGDARRVARAVFVRDTLHTLYIAHRTSGIDSTDHGSLAELVDPAEEHLEHIANVMGQRSIVALPTTEGDSA